MINLFVVDKTLRERESMESRLIGSGEPRRAQFEMSHYDTLWHTRNLT